MYPTYCLEKTCKINRIFVIGPGNKGSIPCRVIPKTQKLYLIRPCLTHSIIRYHSRVEWITPKKGAAPLLYILVL